jgi:hypothetical protein
MLATLVSTSAPNPKNTPPSLRNMQAYRMNKKMFHKTFGYISTL